MWRKEIIIQKKKKLFSKQMIIGVEIKEKDLLDKILCKEMLRPL